MRLRFLSIIPFLVLSGCTTNEKSDSSHTINQNDKVFYNVSYSFYYEKHCYLVSTGDDNYYNVPPKNYYLVEIDAYEYNKTAKGLVFNEFYLGTNELFVYVRK